MVNHKYSTGVLLIILFLGVIIVFGESFDIGDSAIECANGEIAKVNSSGLWSCDDDLTGNFTGDLVSYVKSNTTNNVTIRFNGTAI